MATKSNTFGSTDTLTVTCTETSVDVANNRSQVTLQLQIIGGGTWYSFHDGTASVSVNGSQVSSVTGSATDMPSPGTTTVTPISGVTAWVNHDSNGLATISFSGHLNWPQFPINVDTGNGSLVLTNIVQAPSAPSGVSASRVSDTSTTVSWTNNQPTYHAYASINIYRSVDGGAFNSLVTGLGVVTSYSDTTTSANHKYAYKVEAVNAKGTALSAASSAIWTTPGTPTIGTATKQPNTDIIVTWTNNSNYSEYQVDIYESVNGGAFNYVNSTPGGNTSWTHTAPPVNVSHAYKVMYETTSMSPTLYGALSAASNTIAAVPTVAESGRSVLGLSGRGSVLPTTANAPTPLSPIGSVARDATGAIVFTWQHNPSDASAQTKYQLQYKIDAGSFVTVGPTTSSVSSYTMPANTLTNGHTITWHVATAGQDGILSAYSSDVVFVTQAVPVVAITQPGGTWGTNQITMNWTYSQPQGSAEASWVAQLKDNLGALIESASGTNQLTYAFSTVLSNSTYTVTISATSASGLTSNTASQTFTVSGVPVPPAPAAEPPPFGPGSSFDTAVMGPLGLGRPMYADIIDALIAGVVKVSRRVEIYESDATTPFAIPNWNARLVEGSITVDRTRDERRMIDVSLENLDGGLVIDPISGFWYDKILKAFWGIKYYDADGWPRLYEVQIGEFMIDSIGEKRFPHVTKVTGRDYTKKCLTSKLPYSLTFPANTPIETIIQALAANAGVTKFALPTTGQAYNLTTVFERGTERWKVMTQVADSIGYEVYFRGDGALTMRPYPDPTYSPLTWVFKGGDPDGTLIDWERTSNDSMIKNHIIVTGKSSTDSTGLTTAIFAEAINDDPGSPTRRSRIGDRVDIVESDYFTDNATAQAFANKRLAIAALETYDVNFSSLILPWIEASDIIDVDDSEGSVYVPTRFLLSSFTLPLGLGPMTAVGKRVVVTGSNQTLGYQ